MNLFLADVKETSTLSLKTASSFLMKCFDSVLFICK